MHIKKSFIIILVFMSFWGCSTRKPVKVIPDDTEIDIESKQKVEYILKKIEKTASSKDLDYLGRNTMNEAVELMDTGPQAAPMLIKYLKQSSNWKFRFWIVDILGFIRNRNNIIPLVEVIEDNTEKEMIRLRACESLKELKYYQAIEHLNISRGLVSNMKVRQKIDELIEYLR